MGGRGTSYYYYSDFYLYQVTESHRGSAERDKQEAEGSAINSATCMLNLKFYNFLYLSKP